MHRPSKEIIGANLIVPGMINTYCDLYFRDFKYVSDSRRRWREPIEDMISSHEIKRIQILVHPFWYYDKEIDVKETLSLFVNSANISRYNSLKSNFSNLDEVLDTTQVSGVIE